jgi:hypothetical protein
MTGAHTCGRRRARPLSTWQRALRGSSTQRSTQRSAGAKCRPCSRRAAAHLGALCVAHAAPEAALGGADHVAAAGSVHALQRHAQREAQPLVQAAGAVGAGALRDDELAKGRGRGQRVTVGGRGRVGAWRREGRARLGGWRRPGRRPRAGQRHASEPAGACGVGIAEWRALGCLGGGVQPERAQASGSGPEAAAAGAGSSSRAAGDRQKRRQRGGVLACRSRGSRPGSCAGRRR